MVLVLYMYEFTLASWQPYQLDTIFLILQVKKLKHRD